LGVHEEPRVHGGNRGVARSLQKELRCVLAAPERGEPEMERVNCYRLVVRGQVRTGAAVTESVHEAVSKILVASFIVVECNLAVIRFSGVSVYC